MKKKDIKNIKQIVKYAAETYKDKYAVKFIDDNEIQCKTYIDIQNDSTYFGKVINKIGNNVALIGRSSYEWIISFLGIVNTGNIAVPIDFKLSVDEICENIMRADVDVIIYSSEFKDLVEKIRERCANVKSLFNMKDIYQKNNLPISDDDIELDDDKCCMIVFTSGTTGKSKGVMLSHRNIAENIKTVSLGLNWDIKSTSLLSVLPIHHVYCLTVDFILTICTGITVCINDSMIHLLDNIKLFKPSAVTLVPMIINYLNKQLTYFYSRNTNMDKKEIAAKIFGGNLNKIVSCGDFLDLEVEKELREFGITIIQGYGMTECSSHVAANSYCIPKVGSVGKVLEGLKVKIVDDEIYVKGSSVMLGYLKDKKATDEVIEDGWFKTGDLGYLDEDGYLYLTGRKKYLIILSSGENVSPEQIENQMMKFPIVKEVLVFDKDDAITAEIYPDEKYINKYKVTDVNMELQKAIQEVNEKNPSYKHITKVIVRKEEFLKTTSKKIRRFYYV